MRKLLTPSVFGIHAVLSESIYFILQAGPIRLSLLINAAKLFTFFVRFCLILVSVRSWNTKSIPRNIEARPTPTCQLRICICICLRLSTFGVETNLPYSSLRCYDYSLYYATYGPDDGGSYHTKRALEFPPSLKYFCRATEIPLLTGFPHSGEFD